MRILIVFLIVVNAILGFIAVNLQYKIRITSQQHYLAKQQETKLRYEFDQWNSEKKIIEGRLNIEAIARNDWGMMPIEKYSGTIEVGPDFRLETH